MKKEILVGFFILLAVLVIFTPFSIGSSTGDSMEPTFSEEDVFLIVPSSDYNIGDIVVYRRQGRNERVVHRIVDKRDNSFITKGDNNNYIDQERQIAPVDEKRIVGKVVQVSGNVPTLPLSRFVNIANSNRSILVGIILLLIILDLIRETEKDKRTQRISVGDIIKTSFIISFIIISVVVYIPASSMVTITITENGVGSTFPKEESINTNFNLNSSNSHFSTEEIYVRGSSVNSYSYNGSVLEVNHGPYDTIGTRILEIEQHSYPLILPREIISYLHNIHPLVASIVIGSILPIFLLIIALFQLDFNRPISRSKIKYIRKIFD